MRRNAKRLLAVLVLLFAAPTFLITARAAQQDKSEPPKIIRKSGGVLQSTATRRVEPSYPPLAAYWTEPEAWPLLIAADGQLAGFVLIDRHSHSGEPCDFNMGEFFVSRLYRREGVGRRAAELAIRERPGRWEIAVARLRSALGASEPELAAEDVRLAGRALDRITGRIDPEAVLGRIFATFCIGK